MATMRLRLENLEGSVDAELRDDVEAAISESARLSTLVDQLLRLARTGAPGVNQAHMVDLMAAIKERQEIWAPLAGERGVTLQTDCNTPCQASVAPGAIEQILDNLLANAIEVAPTGTTITLRAMSHMDIVKLHVIDQGPGMSDDQRQRAFDRFWRGSATTDTGGSGLGLAIVAQLAKESGGEAGLSPAPGSGLDAWVSFPKA
ncbi:MAG: sensor histidine kinase [Acidimicrobiales bacterium]